MARPGVPVSLDTRVIGSPHLKLRKRPAPIRYAVIACPSDVRHSRAGNRGQNTSSRPAREIQNEVEHGNRRGSGAVVGGIAFHREVRILSGLWVWAGAATPKYP